MTDVNWEPEWRNRDILSANRMTCSLGIHIPSHSGDPYSKGETCFTKESWNSDPFCTTQFFITGLKNMIAQLESSFAQCSAQHKDLKTQISEKDDRLKAAFEVLTDGSSRSQEDFVRKKRQKTERESPPRTSSELPRNGVTSNSGLVTLDASLVTCSKDSSTLANWTEQPCSALQAITESDDGTASTIVPPEENVSQKDTQERTATQCDSSTSSESSPMATETCLASKITKSAKENEEKIPRKKEGSSPKLGAAAGDNKLHSECIAGESRIKQNAQKDGNSISSNRSTSDNDRGRPHHEDSWLRSRDRERNRSYDRRSSDRQRWRDSHDRGSYRDRERSISGSNKSYRHESKYDRIDRDSSRTHSWSSQSKDGASNRDSRDRDSDRDRDWRDVQCKKHRRRSSSRERQCTTKSPVRYRETRKSENHQVSDDGRTESPRTPSTVHKDNGPTSAALLKCEPESREPVVESRSTPKTRIVRGGIEEGEIVVEGPENNLDETSGAGLPAGGDTAASGRVKFSGEDNEGGEESANASMGNCGKEDMDIDFPSLEAPVCQKRGGGVADCREQNSVRSDEVVVSPHFTDDASSSDAGANKCALSEWESCDGADAANSQQSDSSSHSPQESGSKDHETDGVLSLNGDTVPVSPVSHSTLNKRVEDVNRLKQNIDHHINLKDFDRAGEYLKEAESLLYSTCPQDLPEVLKPTEFGHFLVALRNMKIGHLSSSAKEMVKKLKGQIVNKSPKLD